jgi:hypothetical protein
MKARPWSFSTRADSTIGILIHPFPFTHTTPIFLHVITHDSASTLISQLQPQSFTLTATVSAFGILMMHGLHDLS